MNPWKQLTSIVSQALLIPGLLFLIGGLVWSLSLLGVESELISAWMLVVLAIVFLLEGEFLSSPIPKTTVEPPSAEPPPLKPDFLRQVGTRRLIEVTLIVFSAFGLFYASRAVSPAVLQSGQITAAPAGNTAAAAKDSSSKQNSEPTTNISTLRISPDIEKALANYLNRPQKSESAFPGGWVGILLLVAIAAGLIGWVVRKHPSTAPPLGAVGLAAAAIKSADHLSRLDRWSFLYVLGLFVVVLACLLWMCWKQVFGSKSSQEPNKEEPSTSQAFTDPKKTEAKKEDSPLAIVFSILVLLWAILVVTYHYTPSQVTGHSTPPPDPGSITTFPPMPLNPITGYKLKQEEPPGGQAVENLKAIAGSAHKGDMLLLLGSADCTAIQLDPKLTNKQLAMNRAKALEDSLKHDPDPVQIKIWPEALNQHDNCKPSENARAVFPILIHSEQSASVQGKP